MLEAAAQIENAEEEKKGDTTKPTSDAISVIFCIDISGSMNSGNRLEFCKQAVAAQISKMAEDNPNRKIGLVVFDNEIEVIGDGIEKSQTITNADNMLMDYAKLLANGQTQAGERLNKTIGETKESLLARVAQIHTKGTTALGPAILTSVAMASKGAPGSQVIVCTDGMANVGIGSFGRGGDAAATQFYDDVGKFAEDTGVMINLVTIAGT